LSRAEQGHLGSSSFWDEESSLQAEITRLKNHLQDLIQNQLSRSAATGSQIAMVQRYREILQDMVSDFSKSQLLVQRARERKELMGSASAGVGSGSSTDPAMEQLLRERNHIHNSMNAANSVLGQADSVQQNLRSQGRSLRNTGGLLGQITTNVPGLNHLVDQIRRRRSRDDKIVAGVIAFCICFTLWYAIG